MELKPSKDTTSPVAAPQAINSSEAPINMPSSQIVNAFHSNSDVDRSARAQHHTLGFRPNQSSPGNHIHDGRASRKLAAGMGEVLTGAKGGNVALTNLIALVKKYIEFTDNTT